MHRLLELLLIEELQDEGSLLRDRKSLNLDQDTWGNVRGKKKADGNCQWEEQPSTYKRKKTKVPARSSQANKVSIKLCSVGTMVRA